MPRINPDTDADGQMPPEQQQPSQDDVRVTVETAYVSERSNPAEHYYFFAYTVTIANHGTHPCQLLTRHWVVTDALGRVEEVRGTGVVGQQPVIRPGETFTYTSACPLPTRSGSMRGAYQLVNGDGVLFTAEIPQFALFDETATN